MATVNSLAPQQNIKSLSLAVIISLLLHGLLLGAIIMLHQERPRPKRVVPVDAICLSTVVPRPAGSGSAPAAPQPPATAPEARPKPVVKPPEPKPKKIVRPPTPPQPEPDPVPVPPKLAMPKPVAPSPTSKPQAQASPPSSSSSARTSAAPGSSGTGRGSGTGQGSGSGPGTGSGSGSGSGQGKGSGSGSILQGYLYEVRRLLEKHKIYPPAARRRHVEGVVVIRFTIAAGGQVNGSSIAQSSGELLLDQGAQDTLERVGKFPPLPAELERSQLTIAVPISYRLAS